MQGHMPRSLLRRSERRVYAVRRLLCGVHRARCVPNPNPNPNLTVVVSTPIEEAEVGVHLLRNVACTHHDETFEVRVGRGIQVNSGTHVP